MTAYIKRFGGLFYGTRYLKFYGATFALYIYMNLIGYFTDQLKGGAVVLAVLGVGLALTVASMYFAYKAVHGRSFPRLKILAATSIVFISIITISVLFDLNQKVVGVMSYGLFIGLMILFFILSSSTIAAMDGDIGKDKDVKKAGSRLNPRKLLGGYLWSTPQQLKNFSIQPIKTVYIDEFRYYPDTRIELGFNGVSKLEQETVMKFSPLDFTKTILVLGGMGSGKTEWILSVATQREQFHRQLFHDTKGDFTQKLYDQNTDFIFNPYDERSVVWDIWSEMETNETLATAFFKNFMRASTKEDDFWSAKSSDVLAELALQVHDDESISKNQKWLELASVIEHWIEKVNDGSDNTKKSLSNTVEMAKDLCYLMAYRSHCGAKQFTIAEWLKTNSRLFLLNNSAYAEKLTPLFSGFTAVLTSILLSKADTKEDLTLMILDEFFALKFDEVTRSNLLTQVRSKGGCLIIGAQYMPLKDKAELQQIDSSRYAMILFQINDGETIKHITALFGNVEFMRVDVSNSDGSSSSNGQSSSASGAHGLAGALVIPLSMVSGGKNKSTSKNISTSEKERKEEFLTPELVASMPQYHHITYIPSEKIIYLGYTKQVALSVINENFKPIESKELRRFKRGDYLTKDEAIEGNEYNMWFFENTEENGEKNND